MPSAHMKSLYNCNLGCVWGGGGVEVGIDTSESLRLAGQLQSSYVVGDLNTLNVESR